MNYTIERTINAPRERVFALLSDYKNLHQWQPGLISYEHDQGEPGTPGATTRAKYRVNGTAVIITETLVNVDPPNKRVTHHDGSGMHNEITHTFVATDNQTTRWIMESSFEGQGAAKMLILFAPGVLKRQTEVFMDAFKTFAEQEITQ